jgi:(p)ppGpp synthase/HD superfamily hydrolase
MSDRSYHAVSDVHSGTRYSVIYSFRQVGSRRAETSRDEAPIGREVELTSEPGPDPREMPGIEPMVQVLRSAAAHETEHSGEDLLTHLVNTYRILRRWDCPDRLCVAGLFHSVYGTEAFDRATFALEQRQTVRELIGPEAEHVVHLYCTATRQSLYESLEHEPPQFLQNFRDGATIPISREDLADLMTVDLANSMEQLSRVSLTADMVGTDRRIYERASPLLPGAAVVEMKWVYQRRNIAPEELSLEARLAMLDPDAQSRIEKVLMETLAAERRSHPAAP